ncbi:MAG TPA: glycerol-3-phosphate dehydrogenase/oxidase [Candidatus Limnocylindrales bacterium]|nr:glycerol-3-phosphate dehydrogenase/oxidase [Candidatus Limnocylindrales bacterium]
MSSSISLTAKGFDVLVIGGGINGVAVARECARNGKRTLLVEQNDFASGTTSRSTRIIHGGLRYLEHGEISLVRESLRERERLLRQSPHLVRPMRFLLVLPAKPRSLLRSAMAVRTGLWLYSRWARVQRTASTGIGDLEKQLDQGRSWSIYSYEDAQCEFPERLVAEWLAESIAAGAVVRNHTQVLEITRSNGRVTGVRLRDRISGQEYAVTAPAIVNATGPWADVVAGSAGIKPARMIGGVRGSHLVLPRFTGAPEQPVYTEALDGRQIFVLPWNGQTLVGTTEVMDSDLPENSQPSAQEVEYLFSNFLRLFPHSGLSRSDVRYVFSGIRPLPYAPGKKYSAITRRHVLHDHSDDGAAGMISVIGGKLTTAASLARDVARKLGMQVPEPASVLAAPVQEEDVESVVRQWSRIVACKARIPEGCAHGIAEWHGRHALAIAHAASLDERLRQPICAHGCHLVAEAVEAVAHESAITLGDILLRRVPVALGACWSEDCTREAAAKIGCALGWDQARVHQEIDAFELERKAFLHPQPVPPGKGRPLEPLPSLRTETA